MDGSIGRPKMLDQAAMSHVLEWLTEERNYTLKKFGTDQDREHLIEWHQSMMGNKEEIAWWDAQLENYFYRARVLGLNNENGRQALAKFVSTAVGMLAATVQEYGLLPRPGVTSGDIQEW